MRDTNELERLITQYDKMGIRLSSNANHYLPAEILEKLLQPHKLTFYFFIFMYSGTADYKLDLQEIRVSDGQLLFALPNQVFTPPPLNEDNQYFKIGFDDDTLALLPQQFAFLLNPLNRQTLCFDPAAKSRVRKIFENLTQLLHVNERITDGDLVLAYLNALLTEFNIGYFKNNDAAGKANPKMLKYIEFKLAVETHLTEQYSINTIAEDLSLSTSSLYGIVKEYSGLSPKEFMTNRLITEAQRKLHYLKLSVKELAYELGFNDPDYFSRLFKKSTGKSVSAFLADRHDLSGK